jgi:murein DD-endopeptidase MepM/ murein hydrolase activator NlpD
MTSRQTGRRIASISAERRRRAAGRGGVGKGGRRQDDRMSAGERRQLFRLLFCGGVFVLLVAAKLALPARMEQINAAISQALEQNMDVQAVFSAVGRAFSGEDELGKTADELYQAVFRPQEQEAVQTSVQASAVKADGSIRFLRECRKPAAEPSDPEKAAGDGGGTERSALTYVLYSDQNIPEGVSMEQAILNFDYAVPVSGAVSSGFGYRNHPVEGEERFHYGVDLAADTGTEIDCFADGTVTAVGESSSYGKYCTVTHTGGYSTLYAHCSRITVSSGSAVRKGEKIAEVGETGIATGPHLHFELHRNGVYLNPIYYVSPA